MDKRKWTKEEIEEFRKKHRAIFYWNKEDSSFLVPKAYGIGLTVNWANPITWIFIFLIMLLIVIRKF